MILVEKYELLKLTQVGKWMKPGTTEETGKVIKELLSKKAPELHRFITDFHLTFNRQIKCQIYAYKLKKV